MKILVKGITIKCDALVHTPLEFEEAVKKGRKRIVWIDSEKSFIYQRS